MAKVIKRFKERHENFKLYEKGDTYTYENKERVAFLVKEGYLEEHFVGIDLATGKDKTAIKHTGGGWYELPNGEKVQGKEEAEQALAKLERGE